MPIQSGAIQPNPANDSVTDSGWGNEIECVLNSHLDQAILRKLWQLFSLSLLHHKSFFVPSFSGEDIIKLLTEWIGSSIPLKTNNLQKSGFIF